MSAHLEEQSPAAEHREDLASEYGLELLAMEQFTSLKESLRPQHVHPA